MTGFYICLIGIGFLLGGSHLDDWRFCAVGLCCLVIACGDFRDQSLS